MEVKPQGKENKLTAPTLETETEKTGAHGMMEQSGRQTEDALWAIAQFQSLLQMAVAGAV